MKESILKALNHLCGHSIIDVYIIRSKPEKKELYSKKQLKNGRKSNTYDMRNIIILSATKNTNGINDKKTKETIFNSGILCNEYINRKDKQVILYISKVDTSGWERLEKQPLSLIRALILGYLEYYQKLYKDTGYSVALHLYTRAKPNYLFPTSDDANNVNKTILTDSELIKWWIKTLSHFPKILIPENGYWYCPTGEHIGQALTVHNDSDNQSESNPLKSNTSICQWTWGYPFTKTALALEEIPQFPDDPKNSLIHSEKRANLINEKTTVAELFEYLAIENFSGNVSACIVLNIVSANGRKENKTIEIEEEESCLTLEEFEALTETILSLNYAQEEDSINSSKILHQYLNDLNKDNKIIYFNYEINKELKSESSITPNVTPNNLTNCIKRKNVNDLQGLIKRKKETPPSDSNSVNDIQGLIKRRKGSPSKDSNNVNDIQGLIKRKK